MAKARTLVGLDVHATTIVAAVLDAETGELGTFRLSGEARRRRRSVRGCRARCARRTRPARPAAGPAREPAHRSVECVVAAPSKIPRASGDR